MAKYERRFTGSFQTALDTLHEAILHNSVSASLEDESNWVCDGVRCAVRVYERYSYLGKNRVSMTLTLVGNGEDLFLSLITSGGSQAVFFKINTFGEEAFLDTIRSVAESL